MRFARTLRALLPALLAATLSAGCGGEMGDLRAQIETIKARPGGRIEPLPEIKPYETFTYEAHNLRSPFTPDRPEVAQGGSGPRPDPNRPREFLEQFPLDTLSMVGTMELQGRTFGLVQTNDGLIHRVLPGNHMGQNDGRIISVGECEIQLIEIIPDGLGGYLERPAAVACKE